MTTITDPVAPNNGATETLTAGAADPQMSATALTPSDTTETNGVVDTVLDEAKQLATDAAASLVEPTTVSGKVVGNTATVTYVGTYALRNPFTGQDYAPNVAVANVTVDNWTLLQAAHGLLTLA